MTKAEKAVLAAVELELAEARTEAALRWTTPVAPDLEPPESFLDVVNGWSFNAHNGTVYETWSDGVNHGSGHAVEGVRPQFASQRPIRQYSTRLLAWRALRHELEREAAAKLRRVDLAIEAEIGAKP